VTDRAELLGEYVPYRELNGVSRPIVTATFVLGDELHDHLMLIDSGADNIVLPRYMLDLFGLDEAQCSVRTGFTLSVHQQALIGPEFEVSLVDLWPDHSFPGRIVFAEWLDERSYGLLGREPTLDHFCVRFGHDPAYGFYFQRTAA
jgi:hypothetical protein